VAATRTRCSASHLLVAASCRGSASRLKTLREHGGRYLSKTIPSSSCSTLYIPGIENGFPCIVGEESCPIYRLVVRCACYNFGLQSILKSPSTRKWYLATMVFSNLSRGIKYNGNKIIYKLF
jgi:hypothetical protein